ncbi:MAG: N-formylglutamate amidohydrolase [Gemmatimonadaceae bacterium]
MNVSTDEAATAGDAAPNQQLSRGAVTRRFSGDLEGESVAEVLIARGAADRLGYVASDRFSGRVNGRSGSFVFQHGGTIDRGALTPFGYVVPGAEPGSWRGCSARCASSSSRQRRTRSRSVTSSSHRRTVDEPSPSTTIKSSFRLPPESSLRRAPHLRGRWRPWPISAHRSAPPRETPARRTLRVPAEARAALLLSDTELERELARMTDSFTDELFHLEPERATTIRFGVSRLVVDETLAVHDRCLLIDCHSFPSVARSYESDQSSPRPDICIGTDDFHTSAALIAKSRSLFEQAGLTVAIDRPYAGALVPVSHHRRDRRVEALMVEVNRALYMDERSATRLATFQNIRERLRDVLVGLLTGEAEWVAPRYTVSVTPARGS